MPERLNHDRRRFVRAAAMTFAAAQLGAAKSLFAAVDNLPSFTGATGWLNSQTIEQGRRARKSRPHRFLDILLH